MADWADICSSCERKNNSVVALFYCFDCEDKLCEQCESCHKTIKACTHHETQKLDSLKDQIDTLAALKKLSKCQIHPSEEIKYLCVDHDQLCCSECAIVGHRKCSDITSVDEKANRWKESTELNKVTSADNVEKLIETIVKHNTQQKEVITTSEDTIIKSLEDWERETIDTVKQVKTKLLAEVKDITAKLSNEIGTREKYAERIKRNISEGKELKRFTNEKGSATQQYLVQRMEQSTLTELRLQLETISKDTREAYHVRLIEKYPKEDFQKMFRDNFEVKLGLPDKPMHSRSAKLNQTFGTTLNSNYVRYLIWLSNNLLLESCIGNNMLTMWDVNSGITLQTFQCASPAHAMVTLPDGRIIVTLPGSNQLLAMTVHNNQLVLSNTLDVGKGYYGLAYNGNTDTILASCMSDRSIDILNINGRVTDTLPIDEVTKQVVRGSYSIAYSRHQDVCYISGHTQHKVVAVRLDGTIVFTYTHTDLQYPLTIVLDSDDNLYVTSFTRNVVHQLDKTGKHIQLIVSPADNVTFPTGLAFRSDENVFAVTSNVPDKNIHIYEFK